MPKVGGKYLEHLRERSSGKALQIGWVHVKGICALVWGTDGIFVPSLTGKWGLVSSAKDQ